MGSATEKSILFLSLQLKIKLPFEMKISLYNSSLECVTFILFFLRNLSPTINLSFSGGKNTNFQCSCPLFYPFCPQGSWLQMWPSIKFRRVCIHIAMLVITSVIWSFGSPRSPANPILRISPFNQGISENDIHTNKQTVHRNRTVSNWYSPTSCL